MNVLEFAINMELEGEQHYKEQAELNKGNALYNVFLILAKDEKDHADILQNRVDKTAYKLIENENLSIAKSVFKGLGDFKDEIKEIPTQLNLYKDALVRERESVDVYKKLLSEATDEDSKILFGFLIKQEEEHYSVIDELISAITNSEDWVESAEFGIREEY